ncbi:MAG TPA: hypothetical protein VJ385_10295 [Fibrobacteria bacterium]|nr:hypothetical protein [Fibrobacteria bacterium]
MARRNLGREPEIGKRWPYKALNYLPSRQLWKYLTWKSGGDFAAPPFSLGKALSGRLRILIRLPEDFRQILIAFPVVQSLIQDLADSEFLFLTRQEWVGFLSALFGPDRILGMRAEDFQWGEPHFQEVVRSTGAFRPDLILNLGEETPPLMHFLLRSSRAGLRVQVSGEAPRPFANVLLHPSDPPNHLRRFLQTIRLWNFSARPIVPKWSRLGVSPENLKDAAARLTAKGLRPESTRLFLWQGANPVRERELFQAAVKARSPQGAAQALLVLNGAGPLWASPPPPQDLTLSLPGLEVESTGLLLGLFSLTARSIGTNGPLLHLAGIADTDVEARFGEEDSPWDTSFLNPRLRVVYERPGENGQREKTQGTP